MSMKDGNQTPSSLRDRRTALRRRAREASAAIERSFKAVNELYDCPCCGYLTLTRPRIAYCSICMWADDGQDDETSSVVEGGPNQDLSLDEARANFRRYLVKFGMSDSRAEHERLLLDKKRELIEDFESTLSTASDYEAFFALVRACAHMAALRSARSELYRS